MKTNFNLNVGNGSIVAISCIMQKPCGLVLVGQVTKGEVSIRDAVRIQAGVKDPICDEIKRIESYHEEVLTASVDQKIGICLEISSKEDLVEYLS